MSSDFSLRKSYSLLIVLAGLLSVLSFLTYYEGHWISGYLSDVAAGIIGSLFIIFLVDRIIERNRETDRRRVVGIALQRLRYPILWHMNLLCNIYKAATQKKPKPLPTTFQDTFVDDYYKEIAFLDFAKDAGVALKRDWFTHLDLETKHFTERLEKTIDAYSVFLDVELMDIVERIVNSSFVVFIPQVRMVPEVDRQHGVKRAHYRMLSGTEAVVKEYVSLVLELIEYFNSHSESPIKLIQGWWSDIQSPKWGSGRVSSLP